jgi:hypothetical protein
VIDVSGFALDRLSPIHRSAACGSDRRRLCSPLLLKGLPRFAPPKVSRRALCSPDAPCGALGARLLAGASFHPPSSRHLLAGVVEASSRSFSRGTRGRRRARYVPTDVYNPRDLFSTTSTFVSAHSDPLCPPGLLLGFLPRDASRRGQPTRLGNDRSHADRSLGRSVGPHTTLSIAFVPRGRSPWRPSSPFRAADVRRELRARVMREWWSARPEAPRERSFRGLERSRMPFTPHSPPVAGRRIDRSQARSPRTRR